MSFSVQVPGAEGIEWSGNDLAGVFAQRRNAWRPRFWRMLVDILRFNRPMEEWPALARSWLEGGHHSQALEDFAALSPAEGAALADLMIDVLRSLGVDVPIDGDIGTHVVRISGFEARCRRAVEPVAADLRNTWRDVEVGVLDSGGDYYWGLLSAQLLIGDYNSPDEPMTVDMDHDELVGTAANQATNTLLVHLGVRWPVCTSHAAQLGPYSPQGAPGSAATWWCPAPPKPHRVARIGELVSRHAHAQNLWWAGQRELPPTRS